MTAAPKPADHESNAFHAKFAPHPTETPSQPMPTLRVSAVRLPLTTRSVGAESALLDPSAWGAEVDVPWWLSAGFRFFEPEPS